MSVHNLLCGIKGASDGSNAFLLLNDHFKYHNATLVGIMEPQIVELLLWVTPPWNPWNPLTTNALYVLKRCRWNWPGITWRGIIVATRESFEEGKLMSPRSMGSIKTSSAL